MKLKIQRLLGLFLAAAVLPAAVHPCTTFCMKDKSGNLLFGRNFDFPTGLGQVHINQRNVQKTSMIPSPERSFTWSSKYGSITFNQNGREFPYGGINEAGLVIEQMWHDDGTYPKLDDRYGMEELQWIQYQLDVSARVSDVINSDRAVRISYTSAAPLHFLVADARGDVAAIEYVDGQMVYHTGKDLPYPVLSNDTYDVSLDYKMNLDAGGDKTFSGRTKNYSGRFAKAASMLAAYDKNKDRATDYAFDVLDQVAQGNTQWNIVYDLKKRTIYYRTRDNRNIRRIEMNQFDFSCSSAWLCVDIEDNVRDAAGFKTYSSESNTKLIDDVWNRVEFLKRLPGEIRAAFAKYPSGVKCAKNK